MDYARRFNDNKIILLETRRFNKNAPQETTMATTQESDYDNQPNKNTIEFVNPSNKNTVEFVETEKDATRLKENREPLNNKDQPMTIQIKTSISLARQPRSNSKQYHKFPMRTKF
jgi:hypothetical protein